MKKLSSSVSYQRGLQRRRIEQVVTFGGAAGGSAEARPVASEKTLTTVRVSASGGGAPSRYCRWGPLPPAAVTGQASYQLAEAEEQRRPIGEGNNRRKARFWRGALAAPGKAPQFITAVTEFVFALS
jgi:hypothetical protein